MIRDLQLDDIRDGLDAGTMLVVDVREPHELGSGMIPGSVSLPLSRFDPGAPVLAEPRRIVFSCAAGVRSRVAIELCRAAGLDLNEHYVGGFHEWARSGEPVAVAAAPSRLRSTPD